MKKKFTLTENFPANKPGLWYFFPYDENAYAKGEPTKGFGSIRYDEGSVYVGDLFFDGQNYNKLGFGQQSFSFSNIGAIDHNIEERLYKFVGEYDYRKTDWIYGNGVFYYVDKENKPSRFVKGFYMGLIKIGEYEGEFDYSQLIRGYTKDMESDYEPRRALLRDELKSYENITDFDALLIGDSYYEFWFNREYSGIPFYKTFSKEHFLNIGVGGTTYREWILFAQELKGIKEPKHIFVNLGFNDLHLGWNVTDTFNNMKELVMILKVMFPNSQIHINNIVHAPSFKTATRKETLYNHMLEEHKEELGIDVVNLCDIIKHKEKNRGLLCYHEDNIHLNPLGYQELFNIVRSTVNKNK